MLKIPKIKIKIFPNKKTINFVDLGCGKGDLIRRFGKDGKRVIGVDNWYSVKSSEKIKKSDMFKFLKKQRSNSIKVINSDMSLAFGTDIYTYGKKREVYKEIKRVLVKNGRLILTCRKFHAEKEIELLKEAGYEVYSRPLKEKETEKTPWIKFEKYMSSDDSSKPHIIFAVKRK
ncbi:MAG: class I SAM-dependent methyltransferase [Candidatus Diapherotrites archaeon]